jgi:hypothetical protein
MISMHSLVVLTILLPALFTVASAKKSPSDYSEVTAPTYSIDLGLQKPEDRWANLISTKCDYLSEYVPTQMTLIGGI